MDKIVYTLESELGKFGIKNDGTSPKETSMGLNQALQYAKKQGFSKIIFPKGTYLIDETIPIDINLANVVLDLNGSTLQLNTNGLETYAIMRVLDGSENVRITNGILRGDRDTHNYSAGDGVHEWGCGILFKGGKNLQMDNVTVTKVTGYGISIEAAIDKNFRFHTLESKNTTQGAISDNGEMIPSTITTRTVQPYDISVCGGKFELGYTLGYLGYPYLLNREYTAYFYDSNMNFIQKKECLQFKKVDIPAGAKYAHFVYPQASITPSYYAYISNYRPPTNSRIVNCLIKENRCLGLAVCGGQQWTIEDNVFENNGGAAASMAIDIEDGFELIQDYLIKNNKLINNSDDLSVAAGDNLSFEGNELQKAAVFYGRITNLTVTGNTFSYWVDYRVKRSECKISYNQYNNCRIRTSSESDLAFTLDNETFNNCKLDFDYEGNGTVTKLTNCTLQATNNPYIKNADMESCNINVTSATVVDSTFKNCVINNAVWYFLLNQYLEGCDIINSKFSTHTNTVKIHFKDCEFVNGQMSYTTWGAAAETVFEQCKVTMDSNMPLVCLSAGKTRNLVFKNNTVVNKTAKPVIELYDTTYSVPNGNATIEGNSFTETNYAYAFDGVNIAQGIFNLTERNNTLIGNQLIQPKYVGNQFFNIVQ